MFWLMQGVMQGAGPMFEVRQELLQVSFRNSGAAYLTLPLNAGG
jgi:hypothetical protein